MPNDPEYWIAGLTKFDALELKKNSAFRVTEEQVPNGAYGELTTITACVTVAGISALAAFLLKKHNGEEFFEEVVEVKPDGSTKRRVVKWSKESSEAPEASIIKQIRGDL